ncbi:MAG: homoserine kinase, partial [Negativicutes bacterium]|nr:homoserine kinase [Negativicutes bacterium]
ELSGGRLSRQTLLQLASRWERHPDNVAPAIYGGMGARVMTGEQGFFHQFQPPLPVQLVVVIPDFILPTVEARRVLPASVPLADAVFNLGRTVLLVTGLMTGRTDNLAVAFEDRLHQPYREVLVPGMRQVLAAAAKAGAMGATLSGAGPCLVAFVCDGGAEAVGEAMENAFAKHGIKAHHKILSIDRDGAQVGDNPGMEVSG